MIRSGVLLWGFPFIWAVVLQKNRFQNPFNLILPFPIVKSFQFKTAYISIGSAIFFLLTFLMGCTEETFIEPKLYGSITGKVLTLADKKPLKNVLVRISPSGKTITPDSLGNFKVDSLPVGPYSIQTSVDKYKTDLSSIDVEENKATSVLVYMVPDNNQNKPPLVATAVAPIDKSTGIQLSAVLRWKASDPDKDSLRYSVVLFNEGQKKYVPNATGLQVDTLAVNKMEK